MEQKRALVIKTYGDPTLCGAIVDGVARQVIPLDGGELTAIKAEYTRLKAREAMRQEADDRRWEETKADLEAQYAVKTHGRIYNTILLTYALICLVIMTLFAKLWLNIENG